MDEEQIKENITALKENIRNEKEFLAEISSMLEHTNTVKDLEKSGYKIEEEEKKLLNKTIDSLLSQISMINDSLPDLLKDASTLKEIGKKKPAKKELVSLKYNHPATQSPQSYVTVKASQKAQFIKELSLTDTTIQKMKKRYNFLDRNKKEEQFKKPSAYARFSNKLFSDLSKKLVHQGHFMDLNKELRKANMPFLSHTYISMSFFTGLVALFFSIVLFILMLFLALTPDPPFIALAQGSILGRFLKYFWIIFAIPVATFFIMVYYPSVEKKAIGKKIDKELPFVTIHMAAIAGSNIEPTNIFSIIVAGQEYPYSKKEIKKVLNQINLYGYDLVGALRSSAALTSSEKLSELFSGFATTITSGGNLEAFLAKRADTLIFDFKTESEKATKVAETFMDIYISVVIAAPMILTLMLVMMSIVPSLDLGLDASVMNLLILLAIALINIVFLVFLHLRQSSM